MLTFFVVTGLLELERSGRRRDYEISCWDTIETPWQKAELSLRVAGISAAMESISSLLESTRSSGEAPHEIGEKKVFHDHNPHYDFCRFNNLGLLILKKLAKDHDNCGKWRGSSPEDYWFHVRGPSSIVGWERRRCQVTGSDIETLVNMLARTTRNTEKCLKREISEIVSTVSNVRDVSRHAAGYPNLQKLGIGILTNLALDTEARERIGGTGGVLKELFNIFFKTHRDNGNQRCVRIAAGEVIAMLCVGEQRQLPPCS